MPSMLYRRLPKQEMPINPHTYNGRVQASKGMGKNQRFIDVRVFENTASDSTQYRPQTSPDPSTAIVC